MQKQAQTTILFMQSACETSRSEPLLIPKASSVISNAQQIIPYGQAKVADDNFESAISCSNDFEMAKFIAYSDCLIQNYIKSHCALRTNTSRQPGMLSFS